jgi:hypothetical protein
LRAKSNHRQNAVNAAGTAICGEGTPTRREPMMASVTRCASVSWTIQRHGSGAMPRVHACTPSRTRR